MTNIDIQKEIIKAGFSDRTQIFVTDASYARPTKKYLLGKFYDFYKGWLSDHKLDVWRDRWDCDNFSSTYYVFTQMCHVKSKRPEQGIAVGELFYMQDIGGGHAINVAVVENGLIAIEPQNGQQVYLSAKEKAGAWLIRF